jgi:hypothetical protein
MRVNEFYRNKEPSRKHLSFFFVFYPAVSRPDNREPQNTLSPFAGNQVGLKSKRLFWQVAFADVTAIYRGK